ncbi:MAG: DUF3237 domain-containing protein [Eubacteriales bacterium]|nr:DUF3237 domain-containing protein [Eubacteriales bacterium]MDD3880741.1 DUF3237 domain-containing protein [Eubacteriales bacterium]MDD3882912.1 DUF3237 domain-containing protein [Eubacteriales bacterium]MDD4511626.1 DUF3237 domain-containing protein [Eubacteriales bacterium]
MKKLMTLSVDCGEALHVGDTREGRLVIIPITGGSFDGDGLRGEVCSGGADWNASLPDGTSHVHARYWIKTDDGAIISVDNEGFLTPSERRFCTTPRFTCDSSGKYAYLSSLTCLGELSVRNGGVTITVWEMD